MPETKKNINGKINDNWPAYLIQSDVQIPGHHVIVITDTGKERIYKTGHVWKHGARTCRVNIHWWRT